MNRSLSVLVLFVLAACDPKQETSSDDKQRVEQERILQEGNSQVGMPAIKNFRERKLLKDIYELRDQADLTTYTYLATEDGRLVFLCDSIGYAIPYATQFTNPEKLEWGSNSRGYGLVTLPQADPNGLFSPGSAEGSWILCKDPNGTEVKPLYVEPRMIVSQFRLERAEPKAEKPTSP